MSKRGRPVATGQEQRYRYYRCRAPQEGIRCPTGLLNANDVEADVVVQVKALAKSRALRDRMLATLAEGDEGEAELLATKASSSCPRARSR